MNTGHFNAERALAELQSRYNFAFADLFIEEGFTVYLFGGALRDMVLGKEWKDADIRAYIPLPPKERDEKAEKILLKAGIGIKSKIKFNDTFTIYRFSTPGHAESTIDFTVVSEQWSVVPDFTVNGLYFDIGTKELIDPHGALEAIQKKELRTVKDPYIQFADEPQMIYRAVKVACQFGFTIEAETFAAKKRHAPLTEGILATVSDDAMPGMTEWFVGNIFRGLKYNPALFVQLWNESGLSHTFLKFTAKRLGLTHSTSEIEECHFTGHEKEYEKSLSRFVSVVARALSSEDPEGTFGKILTLYRLNAPSEYGDFIVNSVKVTYLD